MDDLLILWAGHSYFPSLNRLICGQQGDLQSVMISANMKKLFPQNMAALLVTDTPQQPLASVISHRNHRKPLKIHCRLNNRVTDGETVFTSSGNQCSIYIY